MSNLGFLAKGGLNNCTVVGNALNSFIVHSVYLCYLFFWMKGLFEKIRIGSSLVAFESDEMRYRRKPLDDIFLFYTYRNEAIHNTPF